MLMQKERKNTKRIVIAAVMCLVLAMGGISAYFTSTDSATNTFTVGSVVIDLTEPEFDKDKDEHKDITPNKDFVKDPTVTNTGINDAFVFIKFSIPKANVTVANEDGTKGTRAVQELFDYAIADGWVKVAENKAGSDVNTYVYAYAAGGNCTALAADKSAPVLFDDSKVTFKNVIEGEGLEGTTLNIPVYAYGIQTTDLTSSDVTTPSAVWEVLANQQGVTL